jgi:hypothetical protein
LPKQHYKANEFPTPTHYSPPSYSIFSGLKQAEKAISPDLAFGSETPKIQYVFKEAGRFTPPT